MLRYSECFTHLPSGSYGKHLCRVIVVKTGWAAGATFGSMNVSNDLHNITAVEIRMGPIHGFVEISAGDVQGYERSNWGQGAVAKRLPAGRRAGASGGPHRPAGHVTGGIIARAVAGC